MMLDVTIEADPEWDSSTDWDALVRAAAASAIAESNFPQLADSPRAAELFVRLTSDTEVHALNAQWRGKDKPTNVLSFPLAEPADLEAEVAHAVGQMFGGTLARPAGRKPGVPDMDQAFQKCPGGQDHGACPDLLSVVRDEANHRPAGGYEAIDGAA